MNNNETDEREVYIRMDGVVVEIDDDSIIFTFPDDQVPKWGDNEQ